MLRGDFTEKSDVDFLVEFTPEARPTYFTLVGLEEELGRIMRRKVDLRTPLELNARFRQRVLDSAEVVYARG